MGEERKSRARKGAHYSAPTSYGTPAGQSAAGSLRSATPSHASGCRRRLLRLAIAILAVAPLAPATDFAAPATAARPDDARKAEEQLQAVKAEIERVTREVSAEASGTKVRVATASRSRCPKPHAHDCGPGHVLLPGRPGGVPCGIGAL